MAIGQLLNVANYRDHVDHVPNEAPISELLNGRFVVSARPSRQHAHYQLFSGITFATSLL